MSVHILGLGDSDGNEEAGYLPTQVARTATSRVDPENGQYTSGVMELVERTLRKVARVPTVIVKEKSTYTGTRYFLWKGRESGLKTLVWPERGFIHMEREDGKYKKWTRRDALELAAAFGEQAKVCRYPSERIESQRVHDVLRDVCITAKAQGDPTAMTDAEAWALKESVACFTLPGYGNIIPTKQVTFVGSNIARGAT